MKKHKTPFEVLTGARELLSDPKSWIKGHMAEDGKGNVIYHGSSQAKCFCLAGALMRANIKRSDDTLTTTTMMIHRLCNETGKTIAYGNIAEFNDDPNTTHEDIINVLDKAITYFPDPNKSE